MREVLDVLNEFVVSRGPTILAAIGILIVGWLVAVLISLVIRGALRRTKLDNRIATWLVGEERAQSLEIEKWISRCFFFLAMLFVLVAFFEVLGLTMITEPLRGFLNQVFAYAPRLIGPAILIVVAWVVASGLRFVVRRGLVATKLDEKLSDEAGFEDGETVLLSQTLADAGI